MTALNLCLGNTYLYFRGKFYSQIFGVAMGSPMSVVIANLVMKNVEEGATLTFQTHPNFGGDMFMTRLLLLPSGSSIDPASVAV